MLTTVKRLLSALTADEPDGPLEPSGIAAEHAGSRRGYWMSLAASALVVCLAISGLWYQPGAWGREDWDYFAHHYEACRISILEYGQFPWWNPWNCGGMPLAANPQIGVFSVPMLLTLLLGTWTGLKLSVAIFAVLAAAGAHALAWSITRSSWSSFVAGIVYALNGATALYISVGHLGIICYAFLPWGVWTLRRCRADRRYGWLLGLILATAALTSLHYVTVLLCLVVGLLGITFVIRGAPGERRELVHAALVAAFVVFALAGWRLLLSGQLIWEYPRRADDIFRVDLPLRSLATALTTPGVSLDLLMPNSTLNWHEWGMYVGWFVLGLFCLSLRHGWRWWHTLTVVCLVLAIGNIHWYHPSNWLRSVPVFSTMRVPTRWRVVAMLGLSIASATAIAGLARSRWRWLAIGLSLAVAADMGWQANWIFRQSFLIPPSQRARKPLGEIVQLQSVEVPSRCQSALYPTIRAGSGVIQGYEPLVAASQLPIVTAGLGRSTYRGEYGPREAIQLVEWTPNRIVLTGPAGVPVWINQNPGSYWRINDTRPFAGMRVVDREQPFLFPQPESDRAVVEIAPPLLSWGLAISAVGAVCCLAMLPSHWRQKALWSTVAGVFAVSVGFRLIDLETIPGMNADEAWTGFQTYQLLAGQPFEWKTPTGPPLSPFFTLPQALMQMASPPAYWILRAPAMLTGVALLPLTFVLVRRIFGPCVAWLTTIGLAVAPINIAYARFGWNASQTTLVALIAIYFALSLRPALTAIAFGAALIVHPTNVFLLPILLGPFLATGLGGSNPWRSVAVVVGAGATLTMSAWLMMWWFPRAAPDLMFTMRMRASDSLAFETFFWRYVHLMSGTTVYRFISGAGNDLLTSSIDRCLAIASLGLLGVGGFCMLRRRNLIAIGMVGGLIASAAAFYLVTEPRAIQPHFERYAMFLVTPTVLVGAILVDDLRQAVASSLCGKEELPTNQRLFSPILWSACAAGALFLTSFWVEYFETFDRTGGLSHRAFQAGPREPKRAALTTIRQDAGQAESILILVEGLWLDWPIRYLAADDPRIVVLRFDENEKFPPLWANFLRSGAYVVAYPGSEFEKEARRLLGGATMHSWSIPDCAGEDFLTVLRAEPRSR